MSKPDLYEIYWTLREYFGHRDWWPAETPFEVIIGAILTQNTNWKNVEKAIANLKREKVLGFKALYNLPIQTLAELIRPSGYYNQKAVKTKTFLTFVQENYGGSLKRMFNEDTATLREKLLGIKGIGQETADSILLYAGEHLTFVVDLYTYRITTRHGWLPEEVTYTELQEFFQDRLPRDLDLYQDYHAQLVAVGNQFCRKTPKCNQCPLNKYLPTM